ncbi:MAG TPA: hypothetical protein VHA33_18685 [Candidatus Angelobacter sp.]|jgi:hypothetical protein|nr:hypothetical protein [Candidatus Angelobacter sp.]
MSISAGEIIFPFSMSSSRAAWSTMGCGEFEVCDSTEGEQINMEHKTKVKNDGLEWQHIFMAAQ